MQKSEMEWNIKIDRRGKKSEKERNRHKDKERQEVRNGELEKKKNTKRMKREKETERCSKSDFLDDATTTLA